MLPVSVTAMITDIASRRSICVPLSYPKFGKYLLKNTGCPVAQQRVTLMSVEGDCTIVEHSERN
jgi:hypothetical protein